MKRLALCLLAVPALASCAHFPASLTDWAKAKGLRLAECAATELLSKGDAAACLGPNFIRDLGTEACDQAHELMQSLPAEAPKGREDK